jgi:hypothetical protein
MWNKIQEDSILVFEKARNPKESHDLPRLPKTDFPLGLKVEGIEGIIGIAAQV